MKTAFEWTKSVEFAIGTRSGILRIEFERIIQQIQLDAWKQGMEDATNIVKKEELWLPSYNNVNESKGKIMFYIQKEIKEKATI